MTNRLGGIVRVSVLVGIGALASGAGGCKRRPGGEDRAALATVSGMPIYLDDFKRQYQRNRLEPDDSGPPPAATDQAEKHALLDDLINRRLLLQEAERRSVGVASEEVEAAYNRMRAGWKEDEFVASLKEKDLTPAELKNELREMLLIRKLFRDYVFARVAVTDAEIEAYVKEHPDVMVQPEQVHARQIVVKTVEQAEKIATEILHGLPFEDAAMKYSLSPDGKSGGDMGYFSRGSMPAVFDATCFELKPSDVSKPVASTYGFHLFKVVDKLPGRALSLADVRDRVEAILRRDKERDSHAAKIKELRAAATIVIKEDRLAQVL